MQIYNLQLKAWISIYTDREPALFPVLPPSPAPRHPAHSEESQGLTTSCAQDDEPSADLDLPIPKPEKHPYLQIVMPKSLKSKANFAANFAEIRSYGYNFIRGEKLVINLTGPQKIAYVINLIAHQRSYNLEENKTALIQLKRLARELTPQILRKLPALKSKNIENYEFARDSNETQRGSAKAVHKTSKLRRKGDNKEEIFKQTANRDIVDIEAFNSICYRLLLNQQTPKVRAVHNSSGQRLGVVSRAIPDFRSLHDYYFAKMAEQGRFLSPPQADLIKAGLGRILAAAYCEEENDLHGGNIGYDPDRLLSYKIDNDQATWPVSAKYRNIHPQKIVLDKAQRAYGLRPVDAFPITQRDLNNFPHLSDAKPANFPDKADSSILALRGIENNKDFIRDAFSIFLKRALINKQVFSNIAQQTIRNVRLGEQLAAHKARRSELLKTELIANDKFAKFLLSHPGLKKQLLAELGQYNNDYKTTSPLYVDLKTIAAEFDRVKKQSLARYFAKIDSTLGRIFAKSYNPETDFNQPLLFNCKAKRNRALKQIKTGLEVSHRAAEQLFTHAYKHWLEKNKDRQYQARQAEKHLEALMQNLYSLDGKLGWFGGETCQLDNGQEIKIARGAAAIFKHYQDYKRGIQPSAVEALNKIILQAHHSEKYQGHGFFNRRQPEVSQFYRKIMNLSPELWTRVAEDPACGFCL